MNFAGNFVPIGSIDVAELRRRIDTLTEEQWSGFALQRMHDDADRGAWTIGLVFDPDLRHSHPTRLPALEIVKEALQPVLAEVAEHYESSDEGRRLTAQHGLGYFIRATLTRVRAAGAIAPRRDEAFSPLHSHRVHLPVITNEHVLFTVGAETRALPAGEIVEINNRRRHGVVNDGAGDHVQLDLDFVLPGEMCCCGRRLHPDTLCSPRACESTARLEVPCDCYPEGGDPGSR